MGMDFDINKMLDSAIKLYKDHNATIHQDDEHFPYVTLKDDPNGNIKYCAVCFGYEGKLVPLCRNKCLVCSARFNKGVSLHD
ncbi:hypothetical protein [Roseburia inulinivorans]